ncbi:MAG: acyl-CoA dehydrogenase family protein [Rhodobiaceae bacterium]|nr:acyl-CoA dehydrogenase family protein [Rhodobiaceae bacterium]
MILSEEQHALRDASRRFATERLLPHYQQREREARLESGLLQDLGALGFIGMDVSESYGGMGAPAVTTGLVIEALSYGDFNIGSLCVTQSLCGALLERHAHREICQEWLPRVCRGETLLALALTEPGAGSDAGALKLSARRDGNSYVLNGEKNSVTFSDTAGAFIVFARVAGGAGSGITAFIVPADLPGIRKSRFSDIGGHATGRGPVFFDDVRVPADHRLGDEGAAFSKVLGGFDYSRALIALQCIGAAQASVDEAWAYTREREAFGVPISRFQGVTFPLVEGETLLAAGRQLSLHALALRDAGAPHTVEAAMVKWFGPKTAFDVIHQCLLTFGHYGWSTALPHQQRLRDVMGLEIGDGTAGIMKMIVSRARTGRAAIPDRRHY